MTQGCPERTFQLTPDPPETPGENKLNEGHNEGEKKSKDKRKKTARVTSAFSWPVKGSVSKRGETAVLVISSEIHVCVSLFKVNFIALCELTGVMMQLSWLYSAVLCVALPSATVRDPFSFTCHPLPSLKTAPPASMSHGPLCRTLGVLKKSGSV